jgi:hypothetical protein
MALAFFGQAPVFGRHTCGDQLPGTVTSSELPIFAGARK